MARIKSSNTPPELTPERVIQAIAAANAPLSIEDLAAALSLPFAQREPLNSLLAQLQTAGRVLVNRKGLVLLPARADLIVGKVQGHRDGFGFLIREDGGPDVYLPAKEMVKVLHGDRVLVKQIGTDRRGKPEGVIAEVIERRTDKLVGRYLVERGITVVVPEDQRIKHDILVPPSESGGAQPGQVVMVRIIEQPSRYTQPLGKVVEVLGEIDDPGMEIEIAVRKFDVPYQFSDAAKAQAAELPEMVTAADLKGRVDLRDVPLVTIDGEDARDFDDAVYCEPVTIGKGKAAVNGFRLLVAIADVSHYVKDGAPLDIDARERCTSVYFPRRVIPMLPEKLSNGLCSLNPHVDRLCMVADMMITDEGEVHAYQFYPAVMHSQARLTYNEVWAILSQPTAPAREKRADIVPHLENLYALFQALGKSRLVRGAIDFETVETYIECNASGRIERILPRVRNDAHKLIEECMLVANVCAADFVARAKQYTLYRVHEGPTPDRLQNLREFLKTLGLLLGGGDEPHGKDYAALMKRIAGRPDAQLLQTMLLRSMQRAIYTPDNSGHFGLAYEAYGHFTSPIRRYPDLLMHRAIKAVLAGEKYIPSDDAGMRAEPLPKNKKEAAAVEYARWDKLGLVCSANERRADDASNDVMAWLKCYYMRDRVGEEFSGTISSVAPFGVFVTLDTLFVEGMVHVSELGTEYFQFNESLHELRGERSGIRYRLTDRIHIQVARVDLEARRMEFRLVKSPVEQASEAALESAGGKAGRAPKRAAPAKPRGIARDMQTRDPALVATDALESATASRQGKAAKTHAAKLQFTGARRAQPGKPRTAGKGGKGSGAKKSNRLRSR
jgi:ribonuclease R